MSRGQRSVSDIPDGFIGYRRRDFRDSVQRIANDWMVFAVLRSIVGADVRRLILLELRSTTLMTLIRRWAELDSVAALAYLEKSTGLRPGDRAEVLADFASTKNP